MTKNRCLEAFQKAWNVEITGDDDLSTQIALENWQLAWKAAAEAEREECAKICGDMALKVYDHAKGPFLACAEAIRARVNHNGK